jgi:hypothetical protein
MFPGIFPKNPKNLELDFLERLNDRDFLQMYYFNLKN